MEEGKKRKVILGAAIGAVVLVAAIVVLIVWLLGKDKIKATTMRLLRIVGEVTLEEKGSSKTIIDNLLLKDGSALSTGADSLASVGLDDTKIMSVEENSRAEFYQDGKKLELILTKGRLFFDVQQPLAENESLDIKSSTMVVGIRGTSGYVWEDPARGIQYIYITDGHVNITGYNPQTGKTEEVTVGPGQRVTAYMNDDGTFNTFKVEDVSEEDLPAALIRELFNNPDTLERVLKATGYDKKKLEKKLLEDEESSYISLEDIELPEPEPEPQPVKKETKEEEPEVIEEEPVETVASVDETPVVTPKPASAPTPVSVAEPEPEPESEESYEEPEQPASQPEPAATQTQTQTQIQTQTPTDTSQGSGSGGGSGTGGGTGGGTSTSTTITGTPRSFSQGDSLVLENVSYGTTSGPINVNLVHSVISNLNVSVVNDPDDGLDYLVLSYAPVSNTSGKFEFSNNWASFENFMGEAQHTDDAFSYANGTYSFKVASLENIARDTMVYRTTDHIDVEVEAKQGVTLGMDSPLNTIEIQDVGIDNLKVITIKSYNIGGTTSSDNVTGTIEGSNVIYRHSSFVAGETIRAYYDATNYNEWTVDAATGALVIPKTTLQSYDDGTVLSLSRP